MNENKNVEMSVIACFIFKSCDVVRVLLIDQNKRTSLTFEPRCEKTGLRGIRPGPTQTRLYSHRRWLEA